MSAEFDASVRKRLERLGYTLSPSRYPGCVVVEHRELHSYHGHMTATEAAAKLLGEKSAEGTVTK